MPLKNCTQIQVKVLCKTKYLFFCKKINALTINPNIPFYLENHIPVIKYSNNKQQYWNRNSFYLIVNDINII